MGSGTDLDDVNKRKSCIYWDSNSVLSAIQAVASSYTDGLPRLGHDMNRFACAVALALLTTRILVPKQITVENTVT
jgi:hypothetical protein